MAGDARSCQMHETEGYRPIRFSWHMEIKLEAAPRAPVWPDGIELRPFVKEQHDHALFEAHEEAFSDHWGHTPHAFEYWQHHMSDREDHDPSLWFVAWDHRSAQSPLSLPLLWDMAGQHAGVSVPSAARTRQLSLPHLMSLQAG
jgi:hypothetical protein